ncbi:AbiEi_1 domain-containing protein [Gammaproteobacteria bacterium]
MKNKKPLTLPKFIDKLQSEGRYSFLKKEAITSLKISKDSFKASVWRLMKKKRLIKPKHNFYVIVPLEYSRLGYPPVQWFIDDLMKALKIPYYVGLFTAAAIHGSKNQQPNIFQVMTEKTVRPIKLGAVTIDFVCNNLVRKTSIEQISTPTGYMNVSTPEATAYDLIKYLHFFGDINKVAVTVSGFAKRLREDKLSNIAQRLAPIRNTQRLGYILDYIKSGVNTDRLSNLLRKKCAYYIPLICGKKITAKIKRNKNKRWKLFVIY